MGPPHGDLVNLFTEAPTGLLSWAFVYCLQLLGWGGGVPQSLAEPEQASLLWTLPLMPTPQLLKKKKKTPRDSCGRTGYQLQSLQLPHSNLFLHFQAREQALAQQDSPAWGTTGELARDLVWMGLSACLGKVTVVHIC